MSAPAPNTRTIFVYGTLLRGERNHAVMARPHYLGDAATEPAFELVHMGNYPALVAGGGLSVAGELYALDTDDLVSVDALEQHPDFYLRTPIRLCDGRTAEAYLLRVDQTVGRPRIDSGDWRSAPRELRAALTQKP